MTNVVEHVWGSDLGQPTWSPGWSHFFPLQAGGAPCLFLYSATNGSVGVGRLRPGGAGFDWPFGSWEGAENGTPRWSAWWSHMVPLTIGGTQHLFIYNPYEGAVGLGRVRPGATGIDWRYGSWEGVSNLTPRWSTGWTHFVPLTMEGAQYLFIYNPHEGAAGLGRVQPGATGFDWGYGTWEGVSNLTPRWSAGWTHFVPLTVEGAQYLFIHNAENGAVGLGRVRADGGWIDWPWASWEGVPNVTPPWSTGWTHFVPFTMEDAQYLFIYKAHDGSMGIGRVLPGGAGIEWTHASWAGAGNWSPGWSPLLLDAPGAPWLFLYNAGTGAVGVGRVQPGGKGFDWPWGSWLPGGEPLPAGLTHFAPLRGESGGYAAFYDAASGRVGTLALAAGASAAVRPVFGIDVSKHQSSTGEGTVCHVDWEKVHGWGRIRNEPVRFAFIKVSGHHVLSSGAVPEDPSFRYNFDHVRRVPIVRGYYHFLAEASLVAAGSVAEAEAQGEMEARFFIDRVETAVQRHTGAAGWDRGSLPPVLDFEFQDGAPPPGPAQRERVLAGMRTFLRVVHGRWGERPIIYTNRNSWEMIGNPAEFFHHPLWVTYVPHTDWSSPTDAELAAGPTLCPPTTSFPSWEFWQYANNPGTGGEWIQGIHGCGDAKTFRKVDVNRFHADDFKSLAGKASLTHPEYTLGGPELARGDLGKGWRAFAGFVGDGRPYLFGYRDTGEVATLRFDPVVKDGVPTMKPDWTVTPVWSGSWDPGWTHFVAFELFEVGVGPQPYLLACMPSAGLVTIKRLARGGTGMDKETAPGKPAAWTPPPDLMGMWARHWSSMVSFSLYGADGHAQPYVLMYSDAAATAGEILIARVEAKGHGVTPVWGTWVNGSQRWHPGWSAFASLRLRGADGRPYPCVLAVKFNGEVTLEKINPGGLGTTTLWGTPRDASIRWEAGYAWLAAFEACDLGEEPRTYVLAYNPTSGDARIDRLEPDGSNVVNVWRKTAKDPNPWSPRWESFVTIGLVLTTHNGPVPHYFCYNSDTGTWSLDHF